MHWADEIAKAIIEKYPDEEVYTCASGISPSGVVHIGNFREVVTTFFVVKALRDLGKKVRFLYSWDEFDRLRKVPAGLPAEFSKYIGMPLSAVPDPYGCHQSWAQHFEEPFISALKQFGIEADFVFQAKEYQSGRYKESIKEALAHRREIYDIQMSFKTQEASESEREDYYPIQIYCQSCGHDCTKVLSVSPDCRMVEYQCKCGHHHTLDLDHDFCVKLPWKVDWPMRWREEKVLFEPGGRDHSSEGGSYQVSSVIARQIFKKEPPMYRMYDFVNMKGQNKKISSSSGTDITPSTLLNIYPPEILLWMFTRFLPEKSLEIALDSEVLRTYHEFDRMYKSYQDGEGDEVINRIMELALSCTENKNFKPIDASNIASFAPIVNFDLELLTQLFNKLGQPVTVEEVRPRFEKIEHWLKHYCPEQILNLRSSPNTEFAKSISDEERQWVAKVRSQLAAGELSPEDMQTFLYDITKVDGVPDKARQKRFFEIIYNLLFGTDKGPRLYLFLAAVDRDKILKLLEI